MKSILKTINKSTRYLKNSSPLIMNQHAECIYAHCVTRPFLQYIRFHYSAKYIGLSRTRDKGNMQICKQTE